MCIYTHICVYMHTYLRICELTCIYNIHTCITIVSTMMYVMFLVPGPLAAATEIRLEH